MVLKQRARPPSQESKRSLPLKTVKADKSPDRSLKEVKKLELQKRSRPASRQFRSNSQSPQRCTYSSPNPRHKSPTSIRTTPSLSQTLHWDPYGMASGNKGSTRVPRYRDNLYANSKPPSNCSFGSHIPVRDVPMRTKRKNIAEFVDQTTMTMARSSVGSGSRHLVNAPRYSDMFIAPSVLHIRDTQKKSDVYHCSTYVPDKYPLYRTSSYIDPAAARPSHYKYNLLPNYLRPRQHSVTSILSNQVRCDSTSQHYRESKKVLYNEGIFECQLPRPEVRLLKSPPSTPRRGGSRERGHDKSNIPFSHNNNSKYHICCRKPSSRMVTDFEPPTYQQKVYPGPPKQGKGISWPKRVLQSELDIDQFLCTAPDIFMAKNDSLHRNTCPHRFYGEL